MIRVFDQSDENSGTLVTDEMFGLNALSTVNSQDELLMLERYAELGARNLRFPGGSVSEWHFDISDIAGGSHDRTSSSFQGVERSVTPFSEFMELAGNLGVSATLVIPTIDGFTQSAGEALVRGEYGQRVVDAGHLEDVAEFVAMAVAKAAAEGVEIEAFEVGNEFWGSGQMTAAEYGRIAAAISQVVGDTLDDLGVEADRQPDIVVQTVSSAGVFSPNGDGVAHVDEATGSVYLPRELGGLDQGLVDSLTEVTIPSQGRSREQARDIISAFDEDSVAVGSPGEALSSLDISGVADVIDGVVNHYYVDRGFDGVNTEEQYGFNQLDLWNIELDSRGEERSDLEYFITEWNTRKNGAIEDANNRGLQQVSMSMEIFYEMVTHDVTSANFWPVIFNYSNSGTLVFNTAESLTLVGEGFAMMSEGLVGMEPVLDFRLEDEVAIHGYAAPGRQTLFLSERSGAENAMTLDLGDVVTLGSDLYRVTLTELSDGGAGGVDGAAQPVIDTIMEDELVFADDLGAFDIDMEGWSVGRLEIEAVDPSQDASRVTGEVLDRAGQTLDDVSFTLELADGDAALRAVDSSELLDFTTEVGVSGCVVAQRDYDEARDGSIGVGDALDILRMAVGMEPSWGKADALDFIAADFDRDGQVTVADALGVLRFATGLEVEHDMEWVFIDPTADLSQIDGRNTEIDPGVHFDSLEAGATDVSMIGILPGMLLDGA